MEQMRRYGIPASVTLAQGIIESADGRSMLSKTANNHFGVKGEFNGQYVRADDDKPNEKFKKYDNVGQSYEDHSKVLMADRYQKYTKNLSPDDYKGWAKGIKAGGYASSNSYVNTIVGVIEGANLTNVSLIGAKNVPFFPTYLPEGEFIGWKPLPSDVIAKIKIMEDSKRSRALEEICRCDKCIVLEFQDIKGNKLEETEFSYCNLGVYTIGEFSHSGYWDEDSWNPYGGITFYVAKQSAINRLMEG